MIQKKRGSKAQSQIISTMLLILLVIAVMIIVMGFVIPFVQDKLASGDCLDVVGHMEIGSGYTCYNDDTVIENRAMQVQIDVKAISNLINGFAIELGGASTDSFEITDGANGTSDYSPTLITMCNASSNLQIPPRNNNERTYNISFAQKPEIIKVYPILKNGKICDASDTITTIDKCITNKCP